MRNVDVEKTIEMKNMKKYLLLGALCTVLLMAGCKKDKVQGRVFNMGATIEGLTGDDKAHLVNDRWIYWDEQDAISVASNSTGVVDGLDSKHNSTVSGYSNNDAVQGLLSISGTQKGTFYMTLPEDAWEFCALYPYNASNYIKKSSSGYDIICHVPATQPFRADEFGDYTFSKQGCPMVGFTDDIEIQFHALCGIVRVELLSTAEKTISSITFTEESATSKQISGNFGVGGYTTADPYMIQKESTDGRSVTIDCGSGRAISSTNMLTFYLTLPVRSGTASEKYRLTMKVTTTDDKSFTKTMNVDVRRRAITKLRSLTITNWETSGADQGIVGNGTQYRPFQIYTAADLQKIRAVFGEGTSDAYINGIKVTSATYFQIMRSDIELTTSNWGTGIKGFVGHITDVVSGTPGIKNNSGVPIFESIKNGGVVEGVTVKVTSSVTAPTSQAFVSPLCGENRGEIINCITSVNHNFTRGSGTTGEAGGMAAICVRNYKTVSGCAFNCSNPGCLSDQDGVVAGIVLFNESGATISNCETQSTARFSCTRSSVGGICYKNAGTIDGCSSYLMGINNGTFHLGGIAFSNTGTGIVKNCFVMSTTAISLQRWTSPTEVNPTLGGIVNANSGTVDYCYVTASFSAPGIVGGIASSLENGEIKNCWVVGSTLNGTSTNYIGGLVGRMTGGKLANSFARATMSSSGTDRLGYAVGRIDGGTVANCYCTAGTTTNAAKFYASCIGGSVSGYAYNSPATITYGTITSFQNSGGVPMVDENNRLIDKLNSGVTSGYHSWVVSSNYPVLSASAASKSHRGSAKRR